MVWLDNLKRVVQNIVDIEISTQVFVLEVKDVSFILKMMSSR